MYALTNLVAERTKFQIIRVMECFFSLKICVFHRKRFRQNLQFSFQKFFERPGKCCGGLLHAKLPSFTFYCRLTQVNTTLFWKKRKHLSLICQKKLWGDGVRGLGCQILPFIFFWSYPKQLFFFWHASYIYNLTFLKNEFLPGGR